jgi:hypothetical protein
LHGFFNPEDEEITFRVELHPGHAGFEQSLHIMYGLAADGLTDEKFDTQKFHSSQRSCTSERYARTRLVL